MVYRKDPSTPTSTQARSLVPFSVLLGTVDFHGLPRRLFGVFLPSTATRVAWMAVFEAQGRQGGPSGSWMEMGCAGIMPMCRYRAASGWYFTSVFKVSDPENKKNASATFLTFG